MPRPGRTLSITILAWLAAACGDDSAKPATCSPDQAGCEPDGAADARNDASGEGGARVDGGSAGRGGGGSAGDAGSGHDSAVASEGGGSGGHDAGSNDAANDTTVDAGMSVEAGADIDAAPDAGTSAILRVHYPATGGAIAIRGTATGLGWSDGMPAIRSGNTFTYVLSGLAAPAEWKPYLYDQTAALGPSYHVAPGQALDVWPHFTSTVGQVVTLVQTFHSTALGNDRTIYAYLPASYAENTDATYPVVYMQDGQNLWAALPKLVAGPTWNVDAAFDAAASTGTCSANGVVGWGAQPFGAAPTTCLVDADCASGECRTFPEAIVIGVSNTAGRIDEYTPTVDPGMGDGGDADRYLELLVDELKPVVDGLLRTRPGVASTAIAGSSLGGLVTVYAGVRRPEVFGRIAALSPSTWWDGKVIVADVAQTPPAPSRPLVVYLDSGEGSGDGEGDTNLLAAAYLALGYGDGTTFRHVVQPGGLHSETYWAQRFPGAMQFTLGER